MKKWFALALAVLMLVPTLACAASLTVQDFGSFASGLVSLESAKERNHCLEWRYTGTAEEVWTAVDEYAKLLDEKADYKLYLEGYFKPKSSRKNYWLSYTGSGAIDDFSVFNDSQEWAINSCDAYITVYSEGDSLMVWVWLSKDMDTADHGERASVAGSSKSSTKTSSASSSSSSNTIKKNSSSFSSSSTSSSTSRTRCASCGGDGAKERNCISCNGRGKYDCGGCYNGDVRCGACGGTGSSYGDSRCSSCGGDGEKRCSSCSGTGERRCTGCGGSGKKESRCSSCGGDGWR